MATLRRLPAFTVLFALALVAFQALAADYPVAQEGSWVARNFRFHTTASAKCYRRELGDLLRTAPRLAD